MRRLITLAILMLAASGCTINIVNIESRGEKWPIIATPERPTIQPITTSDLQPVSAGVAQKILNNEEKYQNYIRNLEGRIKEYNKIADDKNKNRKGKADTIGNAVTGNTQ